MAIQLAGNTVIHDNQNVQVSGVTTASSFVGDGSQLTNLPASGGTLEATASGTLADGDPVIVNTDGTVSTILQTGSSAWIATLGTGTSDYSRDIALDSSGNVYITGYTQTGVSSRQMLIAKYNSLGVIQWQRTLGGSGVDQGHGIAVDSSGNVYVTGVSMSPDTVVITKYNNSGVIQWQRTLGGSGNHEGHAVAVDNSGNVYITGKHYITGGGQVLIAKYNSSGTLQWQRIVSGEQDNQGKDIKIDSSGNIYIVGYTRTSATYHDVLVMKLDSSASTLWQRSVTTTSNEDDQGYALAIDDSGNVYVTGQASDGNVKCFTAKFNSSGTIQWQRTLDGSTQHDQGHGIAVDSSGNVYITGFGAYASGKSYEIFIAKYNSSGTIQWQRTLGGTGNTYESAEGMAIDSSGNLHIVGWQQSSGDGMYIIKLPSDGSLTGSYSTPGYTLTYAASSMTSANSSFSSSAISRTISASSLTDSAGSLTDAAGSLSSSTTTIASLSTTLTEENFIGISDGAYTNGQTATIQINGSIDDAQSGLTPGQAYYVQGDGTLSETADSPSVLAGTAVASNKLLINSYS